MVRNELEIELWLALVDLAWILLIKLCRLAAVSVFESLSFLCEFPARCWFLVSTGSDSGVHTRRSVPVCESMSRTKRVMVIVRPSALWHKPRIAYSLRGLILRGVCFGFNQ